MEKRINQPIEIGVYSRMTTFDRHANLRILRINPRNGATMKFTSRAGLVALAALLTATALSAPARAGVAIPSDVPNLGLYFVDNFQLGSMPSQIFGVGNQDDSSSFLMCKSDTDPYCVKASRIFANIDLDICKAATVTSCIETVWAVDPSGKKIEGSVSKVVQDNSNQYVSENTVNKLPGSHGLGALWTFPGVTNSSGGNEFFVAVQDRFNGEKNSGDPVSSAKYWQDSFVAGIVPIKEISGTYGVLAANDAQHGNQAWGSQPDGNINTPDGSPCVVTDRTYCAAKALFPADYRFGMTLRLGSKPTGWFSGRLGFPAITTSDTVNGENISIEATPLLVPSLDFTVPNAQIPSAAKKIAFDGTQWGRGGTKNWQIVGEQSDPRMMDMLTAFTPAFENKSTGTDSIWSFKTMIGDNSRDAIYKCSNGLNSFGGLVTSNALTYSDGAPAFDPQSGEMTYKVASPHFREDGTIARGSYDLAVRSSVVRCLYGFSSAPVKATISIQSEDGNEQVATTVVSEKDGWLYLSAKGFTFSSPTIAVKFTQDAAVNPAPKVSAQKSTITCVKGKSSKKVTAIKPSCPAGFKIK